MPRAKGSPTGGRIRHSIIALRYYRDQTRLSRVTSNALEN